MAARHIVWLAVVVCAALLPVAAGPAAASARGGADDPIAAFLDRVEAYAELHRHLDAPVPPLAPGLAPRDVFERQERLAAEIRHARADFEEGTIFTPDVAAQFRATIAVALTPRDVLLLREEARFTHRAAINEPLPRGTDHAFPTRLLHCLPELPKELQYRIVNDDLVLWDVDADLVVDIARDALVVLSYA